MWWRSLLHKHTRSGRIPPFLYHSTHNGEAVIERKLGCEGVGINGGSHCREQQRRERQAAPPPPLLRHVAAASDLCTLYQSSAGNVATQRHGQEPGLGALAQGRRAQPLLRLANMPPVLPLIVESEQCPYKRPMGVFWTPPRHARSTARCGGRTDPRCSLTVQLIGFALRPALFVL